MGAPAARTGRWTVGRIPFGFGLDYKHCLVASERMTTKLGMTDADAARDLFRPVAEGSSAIAEAWRLTAAWVAPTCHYGGNLKGPAVETVDRPGDRVHCSGSPSRHG